MQLAAFCDRLDEELRTADFADIDASPNGLQVGPETAQVERVAFATDGVAETFDLAAEWDADAIVCHHGISWGGIERVTGRHYKRVAPLIENDVALYVSHLPLDSHPTLGNAAGIADLLDLDWREGFGQVGPETVGLRGRLTEATTSEDLRELLADELSTGDQPVQVLDHGPDEIEDVGITTGDGSGYVDEAADLGLDALVMGEGKQKTYHEAKEAGLTVILAGHYATETFGVRNLQSWIETEWEESFETTFFDVPTGI
ncbi:Nif3-like dinuclear metal center hexameric protein [Haloarchaeobius sp. DFWS5]|uniref:Nif3-like dinuclear metal center hexameric protein n=1 Tax=Haloarchaeobius sp. DFWS5 TaxID=3446114 RepID=UPI003EBDC486